MRGCWPKGLAGRDLDGFARYNLWLAGQDFDHGTGHGVGAFLSVHEGPQRISRISEVPLEPGMILSNEPGYYKAGDFGIRIENLVLIEPRTIAGAEGEYFGFETLTFAPIDRNLVDLALLSVDEIAWWNAYHAKVEAILAPQLSGEALVWLKAACAPLQSI